MDSSFSKKEINQQNNNLCKLHKREIIFICSCNQKYLCSTCFSSGIHSQHNVDIYNNDLSLDPIDQTEISYSNKKSNYTKVKSISSELKSIEKDEEKKLNDQKIKDRQEDIEQYNEQNNEMKDNQKGQLIEINGDLLDFEADIIVQQCNCITTNAKGLSQAIYDKFGVSAYTNRIKESSGNYNNNIAKLSSISTPGTCTFVKPKNIFKIHKIKYIANFFSQFAPGKNGYKYQNTLCKQVIDPSTNSSIIDNPYHREKWFQQCLKKLSIFAKEQNLSKIAFPYNIGCGLAGGTWNNYYKYIQEFSQSNNNLSVYIVKLP